MLSPLLAQMETMLPAMDGWCTVERATDLMSLVIGLRPRVSVEIGVWCGRATLPIAMAHRYVGQGYIIAIDPWAAKASAEGQTGADKAWWDDQSKHDLILSRFNDKIAELDLANFIKVQRSTSDAFEPPAIIDLLLIDGNHGDQAIRDVERYADRVRIGGVVFADDLHWAGGSVLKAVEKLEALGFIELYRRDQGAFFQRVSC